MPHPIAIAVCILLLVAGCTTNSPHSPHREIGGTAPFTLPSIPTMLTTPEQQTGYLVAHYWDTYNFGDTALVRNPDITEQAFSNYIHLFPRTTQEVVETSIRMMLRRAAEADSATFAHFAALYERYLDDPNSPFRNEEHYIPVLQTIIASPQVDELMKIRPRYRLEKALQNRVGEVAADFTFTVSNGRTTRMSKLTAHYTILYFNNPDCHDCARVKEILASAPVLQRMMQTGSRSRLHILAIYPDNDIEAWRMADYPSRWINGNTPHHSINELYDLRAIPTLYLLDKEKHVVLKDAPVEQIISWLEQHIHT